MIVPSIWDHVYIISGWNTQHDQWVNWYSNNFQGLAPDLCRSGAVMAPAVPQNRPSVKYRTHPKSG